MSRPSLYATVLRLAAVATIAAMLVWSVLFVDLVRSRGGVAATTTTQPAGGPSTAHTSRPAQSPAPVTTRTS